MVAEDCLLGHRITVLAEELFEGEAEGLISKAIERALAGDSTALRLCLDRIVPPRRERPVRFRLPTLATPGDAVAALTAIVTAVAAGELTPGEAGELSALVGTLAKTIEITELDNRVRALEKTMLEKQL
jgi:hypothetical protein